MATISTLALNKFDFDDETRRIIGEAFDATCGGLCATGQHALVAKSSRSVLSKRQRKASAIRFVCALLD